MSPGSNSGPYVEKRKAPFRRITKSAHRCSTTKTQSALSQTATSTTVIVQTSDRLFISRGQRGRCWQDLQELQGEAARCILPPTRVGYQRRYFILTWRVQGDSKRGPRSRRWGRTYGSCQQLQGGPNANRDYARPCGTGSNFSSYMTPNSNEIRPRNAPSFYLPCSEHTFAGLEPGTSEDSEPVIRETQNTHVGT